MISDKAPSKIEVIFFQGCPNAEKLFSYLTENSFAYVAVDVETLNPVDIRRNYTSPSVLVGGQLVFGGTAQMGAAGCTYGEFSTEDLARDILSVQRYAGG